MGSRSDLCQFTVSVRACVFLLVAGDFANTISHQPQAKRYIPRGAEHCWKCRRLRERFHIFLEALNFSLIVVLGVVFLSICCLAMQINIAIHVKTFQESVNYVFLFFLMHILVMHDTETMSDMRKYFGSNPSFCLLDYEILLI